MTKAQPVHDLGMIVAMNESRVIGNDNQLLWHLPSDLRRFKSITIGGSIIMGRKTYESIGRPLPGRANVVISRSQDLDLPGCIIVGSLDEALDMLKTQSSPKYVIGGGEVYRAALPYTSFVALTLVHDGGLTGNTTFPELPRAEWDHIKGEIHTQTPEDEFPFSFHEYRRK